MFFGDILSDRIGPLRNTHVNFKIHKLNSKEILIVDCQKSENNPCFYNAKEFYIRHNPKAQLLEGNELFSQAITASSGSNTIEIVAVIYGAPQGTANTNAAIFLDGGSDAIYACQTGHDAGGGNEPANGVVRFRVSAVDTSEHTYTVRVGPNTGNYFPNSNQATNIFPGVAKCTMTVTEYSA